MNQRDATFATRLTLNNNNKKQGRRSGSGRLAGGPFIVPNVAHFAAHCRRESAVADRGAHSPQLRAHWRRQSRPVGRAEGPFHRVRLIGKKRYASWLISVARGQSVVLLCCALSVLSVLFAVRSLCSSALFCAVLCLRAPQTKTFGPANVCARPRALVRTTALLFLLCALLCATSAPLLYAASALC